MTKLKKKKPAGTNAGPTTITTTIVICYCCIHVVAVLYECMYTAIIPLCNETETTMIFSLSVSSRAFVQLMRRTLKAAGGGGKRGG